MRTVAPLATPRETIFAVLASAARKLSYSDLSMIAAASGLIALIAAVAGRASWVLLSACYVVWCFAGWGILFHTAQAPTSRWRVLEAGLVASATSVVVILGIAAFFWALGPRWVL